MSGPKHTLKRPVINGRQSDTWYVCWSEGRRSYRVSAKTTDKVAAQGFLLQFVEVEAAPREGFNVTDLCDAYLAERIEAGVKYPKAIANSLRHIQGHFGTLSPSMISRMTVRSYVTARRKHVVNATITKELLFLRQALKFGVREKWKGAVEPKILVPGISAPRQRFLTRSEFASVYFHASPLHLRTFLALAIDTLARGKHILALTWDRVDFDSGIIWYQPHDAGSKKRTQAAPISPRLRVVLERAREAALSPYVVEWEGQRIASIRKAYERAVRLAGIKSAHKHDLRRTGASWAIQDGQSFDAVAALLGDTVEITRTTYAVFSPSYLGGVVNSIATGRGGTK